MGDCGFIPMSFIEGEEEQGHVVEEQSYVIRTHLVIK